MPYGWEIGEQYEIGDEVVVGEGYEVGDEVEDMLVGAPRPPVRRAGGPRRMLSPAAALQHQRNVAVVRPKEVLRPRNIWLGFPATAIAGGAAGVIAQTPQILFRPERLLWPNLTAPWFTCDQITLGKDNQWGTGVSNVPAEAFMPQAVIPVPLGLDTVAPNTVINILATNFGAAALTARLGMQGQSVQ
jgi:hypothetical protein